MSLKGKTLFVVANHFARPVSRVLRRPAFLRNPARIHSSRAA